MYYILVPWYLVLHLHHTIYTVFPFTHSFIDILIHVCL